MHRLLPILMCVAATGAVMASPTAAQPTAPTTCQTCHEGQTRSNLATPAHDFGASDVHRNRGFTCVDCHGGDANELDRVRAKAPGTGFTGTPSGAATTATCARCHGDATLMRKYAPTQRTDQAAQYATSVHGQRLAAGDPNVATCVSCHGAHGVRVAGDAQSPVYPLNVAATCSTCHADAGRMKGYRRTDGSPLPTDQRERYEKSVHHAAMTDANDLSAPTCNDCHGTHGATPPGVGQVTDVCGTCHAVFATKFALSTHSQVFNTGCVECHGNHDIAKPTDALLGTDAAALCVTCHSEGDHGYTAAAAMRTGLEALKAAIGRSEVLVSSAENAGMDMGEQSLALREAGDRLTLARTEMHAFDPVPVGEVLEEGLAITASVDTAGHAALAEVAFRKKGLAVSLGAILVVVIALGMKIRTLKPPGTASRDPSA